MWRCLYPPIAIDDGWMGIDTARTTIIQHHLFILSSFTKQEKLYRNPTRPRSVPLGHGDTLAELLLETGLHVLLRVVLRLLAVDKVQAGAWAGETSAWPVICGGCDDTPLGLNHAVDKGTREPGEELLGLSAGGVGRSAGQRVSQCAGVPTHGCRGVRSSPRGSRMPWRPRTPRRPRSARARASPCAGRW